MKPAAMKEGKLYSQQPHSGAGDFTFSRANGVQTRINEHGLIETVADNTPRLSYELDADGNVSECPTLLLEPTRTNLIPQSQNFSTNWFRNGGTIENNIPSPDGGTNAYALIENEATGGKLIYDTVSVSAGQITFSLFMKKADKTYTSILLSGAVTTSMLNVNLENGTASTVAGSFDSTNIEAYPSGWYRVSATLTATAGNVNANVYLMNGASYSDRNYTGNGTDKTYIFGAQLEQGSYATSYIPTEGSQVQRTNDNVYNGGDATLLDLDELTFFVDVTPYKGGVFHYASLNDGSNQNRVIFIFNSNNTSFSTRVVSSGSTQINHTENITFETRNKIAIKLKANDAEVYLNGTSIHTDTSFTMPIDLDRVNFSIYANSNNFFEGKVNQLTVFNEALSDSELITLTT